jgi:hypothetical protein
MSSGSTEDFEDLLLAATFTLYNHFNTLSHAYCRQLRPIS